MPLTKKTVVSEKCWKKIESVIAQRTSDGGGGFRARKVEQIEVYDIQPDEEFIVAVARTDVGWMGRTFFPAGNVSKINYELYVIVRKFEEEQEEFSVTRFFSDEGFFNGSSPSIPRINEEKQKIVKHWEKLVAEREELEKLRKDIEEKNARIAELEEKAEKAKIPSNSQTQLKSTRNQFKYFLEAYIVEKKEQIDKEKNSDKQETLQEELEILIEIQKEQLQTQIEIFPKRV